LHKSNPEAIPQRAVVKRFEDTQEHQGISMKYEHSAKILSKPLWHERHLGALGVMVDYLPRS
jgi:hypothetical protein